MSDRQEQWAVFWCSLLSPLLYGEVSPQEAGRFLNELASREQVFPDGQRRRPSRATLWRKWKKYRDGGFEALFRKRRKDRGQPRKATPAMIAKAIELKKEQPYRSDVPIEPVPGSRVLGDDPQIDPVSAFEARRGHAAETGPQPAEGPLPLDQGPFQRLVAGRFRGRTTRAGGRSGGGHPSFGLHRLSQPLRGRGPLLPPRKSGHPHRFPAAGLGRPRGQPRAVLGQRQDLPCPRPEGGLFRLEYPPAPSRCGRSAAGRTDRTLLPHRPRPVGKRGPRRRDSHLGPA